MQEECNMDMADQEASIPRAPSPGEAAQHLPTIARNGNGAKVDTLPARNGSKAEATRPFYRHPRFVVGMIVILALAVGGVYYWLDARNFEETDDAYIDGHVIAITPEVSALVSAVHVQINQFVRKGDLLVELDSTDFDVALQQAQGAEASANGKLEEARADVEAAKSSVAEAQAELDAQHFNFENADSELKRYSALDDRAKSQQTQDNVLATQKTAIAQVEQATAKLQAAQAQVISAQATVLADEGDVKKAMADTRKAQVNLGYCRIFAPVDGRITNKNVEVGAYVTSANPLFAIVPADVWVTANFKETQLDRMQPGQPVTISVDAYPDTEFHGKVDSIQMGTGSRFSVIPAENATGNFVKVVQRVPVKIDFDSDPNGDPKHQLSPGMSVNPKVHVGGEGF
jgi:membrane fusion protein (multidrug efflux system)